MIEWKNRIASFISKIIYKKYYSFNDSTSYWKTRYKSGRNSGDGSYGRLANFKANFISQFLRVEKIESVIEFGCGDGNQLGLIEYPNYIGFDISKLIIDKCRRKFSNDKSKRFDLVSNYKSQKADLSISLDVIFHLVEDEVFFQYMYRLFNSSEKFVLIYSSNVNQPINEKSPHVRHRRFTDFIDTHFHNFKLVEYQANLYSYTGENGTSLSDFFLYKKVI